MVYAPDFSADLEVMYGLDTFTLKVEGQPDVTLQDCVLNEPVDIRETEPTAGQVIQMDQLLVWPIYKSPTRPPLGSVLVDVDGDYWTILAVRRKQHIETWEAHCRNLSVIPAVANYATVLRAEYGRGRANEARPEWKGLFSGQTPQTAADTIPARFQPAGEDAMLRFGSEWTRETYRVILSQKLPMTLAGGEFRLVDELGNRYRITRYYDEQRIDRLPVAICVRIIEGREFFRQGTQPPLPLPAPVFPTAS
jgi:hypothetical protein